jgi:putative membrane protein
MEVEIKQPKNKYNLWIWIISIVVPVAVAVLFTVRIPGVERMGFLPPIYATINALTAVILIISVIQIKKGNRKNHEFLMKTAILLSLLFLLLYIAYHMTSDSTKYGGDGILKYLYYFILITHIMLSITVIPFVLWLYVAITGVIVYVMISPYY